MPLTVGKNAAMRVTAKVDYAVRAAVLLADAAQREAGPLKGEQIANAQQIPVKYLENILSELRQAGIVRSQRGADGGYWLGRPADDVTLADIIRAVEGPLANVRGERPEALRYPDGAGALQDVWIATRAALRSVLEHVTLADVAVGELPTSVQTLIAERDSWEPH
jgi:Rrf2 family protein